MSLEAGKAESTGAMRVEPEKAESLMSAYDSKFQSFYRFPRFCFIWLVFLPLDIRKSL